MVIYQQRWFREPLVTIFYPTWAGGSFWLPFAISIYALHSGSSVDYKYVKATPGLGEGCNFTLISLPAFLLP